MSGLPPKPASFEVHVKGKPPVRTDKLFEAQSIARDAVQAGEEATIADASGNVIERHKPQGHT